MDGLIIPRADLERMNRERAEMVDALHNALNAIDLAARFTPTERLDGQFCSIRESVASCRAIILDAVVKAEGHPHG